MTDNGWTSTGFRGGEGEITFPVDTDIPAGTVWTYETGNTASNSNAFGSWDPVSKLRKLRYFFCCI